MKSATERAVRIALALPFVWLGACSVETTDGTGMVAPGVGNGFPPPMAGMGAAGTAGLGPAPVAGIGGGVAGMGGVAGAPVAMAGSGGMAGTQAMAGSGGMAGTEATAGSGGMAGSEATAGSGSMAGTGGTAGSEAGAGGTAGMGTGECCADGNCLCHGPDPSELTSRAGPFRTESFRVSTGTVHYPTDAEPPFAGVAICGGFTNTGPEMAPWAPFYASHGIVTIITTTGGADVPAIRGQKLLAAVASLKAENARSGSPLFGKMSDRYGTSGYSMGGGGTTIASADDSTLKTSVGLAAWGPVGAGVSVPTLLLCGSADGVAPCSMSQSSYRGIPEATPKMMISISGATHFSWFGPTNAGSGTSGSYALAFQKVYLEGDERWKSLLLGRPSNGTVTTNIQ